LRERNCLAEVGLGQFRVALHEAQFTAEPKHLRSKYYFVRERLKAYFYRLERLWNVPFKSLCLGEACHSLGNPHASSDLAQARYAPPDQRYTFACASETGSRQTKNS
jgi:hypothetical protein